MQHLTNVLSAFKSFKLEEQRGRITSEIDDNEELIEDDLADSQHFFAKFLTNPKLIALQLSDSKFRRSVLLQCLILFQYLTSTVKSKA